MVLGFGGELPTGDTNHIDNQGQVLEPSGQLGRGQVGLVGSMHQAYELIPHRLNQFVYASYRHMFKNNDGYQFADEYILNAGLKWFRWKLLNGSHLRGNRITAISFTMS